MKLVRLERHVQTTVLDMENVDVVEYVNATPSIVVVTVRGLLGVRTFVAVEDLVLRINVCVARCSLVPIVVVQLVLMIVVVEGIVLEVSVCVKLAMRVMIVLKNHCGP